MATTAALLRAARINAGMTQAQLADRAGVSRTTIQALPVESWLEQQMAG
jgi:DNA-binding XRE family transcriptional regulator